MTGHATIHGMPLTLKKINAELAKKGVQLERAGGYFYFRGGPAADWLDKTVPAPKVSSLTLEQWLGEFDRLRKLNGDIARKTPAARKRKKP